MKKFRLILVGLFLILLVIVVFQNLAETDFQFILAKITLPLAVLLLLAFAGGFITGFLVNTIWKMQKRRADKKKEAAEASGSEAAASASVAQKPSSDHETPDNARVNS